MRLLLDEMLSPRIAAQLRNGGSDVVSIQDLGFAGASDRRVFEAAQLERRAVVTENVADYIAFDREWRGRGQGHWGLIFTANRTFPRGRPDTIGALVASLASVLDNLSESEPSSRIVWLRDAADGTDGCGY